MNNSPSYQHILDKICKDPIFRDKEIFKDLLRYLYQCAKENYIPTEIDIASNVLGKDSTFDPSEDTIVRVYFYRLKTQTYQEYKSLILIK